MVHWFSYTLHIHYLPPSSPSIAEILPQVHYICSFRARLLRILQSDWSERGLKISYKPCNKPRNMAYKCLGYL